MRTATPSPDLMLTVPGTLDWALISSVLWIGYFQTSNSVQQTFVR